MAVSGDVGVARLALCQMAVGESKEANHAEAARQIREAAAGGADMVMLPEMFTCPYSVDSFGPYSEALPPTAGEADAALHPTTALLTGLARELGVWIVGGSFPERSGDRLYNTCIVVDRRGEIAARHRKLHLFDISVPGGITFRESDTLTGGAAATAFDTEFGRMAVGICYDLRFPEYAQVCATELGARALLYPGAFNTTTGPPHWELLLRARAVDTQCFVAACSPSRVPGASYQAWGHSSIVSPWGEVIATTGHEAGIVRGALRLAHVDEVRQRVPVRGQRRNDVYASPALRGKAPPARPLRAGVTGAAVALAVGAGLVGVWQAMRRR